MTHHPTDVSALLLDLSAAGIDLAAGPDGTLRVRPAPVPPPLAARLRTHRAALLELLTCPPASIAEPVGSARWCGRVGLAMASRPALRPTAPGKPAPFDDGPDVPEWAAWVARQPRAPPA